ncbi:CAP Gly-rich domain-containing protein [Fennellomyces sp. T-0311]|nr:CAP Gly-rich domain-containing protein [Fennellomyces sp. T-0311]
MSTPTLPADVQVGTRVLVNGDNLGTVRYAGSTSFQTGKWVGVELDEALGKNNGVVQGKRYFECRSNHGVFVRPANIKVLPSNKKVKRTG